MGLTENSALLVTFHPKEAGPRPASCLSSKISARRSPPSSTNSRRRRPPLMLLPSRTNASAHSPPSLKSTASEENGVVRFAIEKAFQALSRFACDTIRLSVLLVSTHGPAHSTG